MSNKENKNKDLLDQKTCVFLPCRKGSERVKNKNTRRFGKFKNGLIEIKLKQLLDCSDVEKIILSTNDENIIEYAQSIICDDKLYIHERRNDLAMSSTSTDSLVGHALELVDKVLPNSNILWTHVTSPFVTACEYSRIIKKFKEILIDKTYDSLMTTTLIHNFLWNEHGPINYDRSLEKWPRTQTLSPLHEVNSAAFIAPSYVYRSQNDRIGNKPYLYRLEKLKGLDIDWEEDFILAEQALINNLTRVD